MRSLSARAIALCLATWYAALVAEPTALHDCAMHGGTHTHAVAAAAPETDAYAWHKSGMADMAGMSNDNDAKLASFATTTTTANDGAPSTPAKGCSCLDCAALDEATADVAAPPVVALVVEHETPRVVASRTTQVEPRRVDRRLAFANAPPTARLA